MFDPIVTLDPVSADHDPNKIKRIIKAGNPKSTTDVHSLFMACYYNAKFIFNTPEIPKAYEQVSAPDKEGLVQMGQRTGGSIPKAYQGNEL